MSRAVEFLDSTLREGEQTPGVSFDREAKLRLFEAIRAAGVRFFDVGMPAAHWEEPKTVRELLALGGGARIGVSARAAPEEIELAASTGVSDVFLIVPTSDLHLRKKLRARPETWAEEVKRLLGLARRRGLAVHYVAEDASRADPAYLRTLMHDARKMAVESVFLCDTVGVLTPERSRALAQMAVKALGPRIDVGFHGHDDMGLAAANTLSALDAGARYASVTVNGLGERCGNASLHEVAVAARRLYGLKHSVRLDALPALARLVEEAAGVLIPPDEPIVGRSAFRHSAGIHVDGTLKDPRAYEPLAPDEVGGERSFGLGKLTGRGFVRRLLAEKRVKATPAELELIVERVKRRAMERRAGGFAELRRAFERHWAETAEFDESILWDAAESVLGKRPKP